MEMDGNFWWPPSLLRVYVYTSIRYIGRSLYVIPWLRLSCKVSISRVEAVMYNQRRAFPRSLLRKEVR
jgi:hypothetical protein